MGHDLHPHYITDEAGKRISVILPIEEYEALTRTQYGEDETAYLLKEPANARRLLESLANVRANKNIVRKFGLFKGQGHVPDDFNNPLPEDFWSGDDP